MKACAWCGDPLTEQRSVYPGGPVKQYCSALCRHRAWRAREKVRGRVGPAEYDLSDEDIERKFQDARFYARRRGYAGFHGQDLPRPTEGR